MDVRWGARSLARRSGAQARARGGSCAFYSCALRGVNVGTKTPILLIVEASRGGGRAGGGRGGPTAAALMNRFCRQEIDGIRDAYSVDYISPTFCCLSLVKHARGRFNNILQLNKPASASCFGRLKYLAVFVA